MADNLIIQNNDKAHQKIHKKDLELSTKKTKTSKIKHPLQSTKFNPSLANFKHNHISSLTPETISSLILHKHSITPIDYNHHIVDNLINSSNNHFIVVFKDHMIMDYIEEFLKREYKVKESLERIPKFANYYKNYLLFFCKPMFSDLKINEMIQQYGEATAKVYYNQNYGKKKKKQKAHLSDKLKIIFSLTVKERIDNNSSLEISKTFDDDSISLTETGILFNNNNKDKHHHISYFEESLISLLDDFQAKKIIGGQKKRSCIKNNIPLPLTLHQGNMAIEQKKKIAAFTERAEISKDRLKGKESSEDLKVLTSHVNGAYHHLSRNSNNSNLDNAQTVNSRNKPIKLTIYQPLHTKTVSVQLQKNKKDNIIKNSTNMNSQTKISSESKMNNNNCNRNNKILTQSKKTLIGQRQFSHNINNTGTLNLTDLMKLTLQLYYPSTKRNTKNTIHYQNNHNHHHSPNQIQQNNNQIQHQNHQQPQLQHHSHHQHTLSSPTINNFNININNHICLNEAKSPKVIRNYNSNYNTNYNNSHSNLNLHQTGINSNIKKQQQTIVDELKKNNFDMKNIIKKQKSLSRNKPQSLIKTKTVDFKMQNNMISRNSININHNKLFTSFSIFDLQQQLLNSKIINQINSKLTINNNYKKNNDYFISNQQQSLSQTKILNNKNLQTVKSQPIKNKGNRNHTGKSINHGEGGVGICTQTNYRFFNNKMI